MEVKKKYLSFFDIFGIRLKGVLFVTLVSSLFMILSTNCFASTTDFSNLTASDYSAIFEYMSINLSSWNVTNINPSTVAPKLLQFSQDSSKMSSLAQQISSYASDFGSIYQVVFAVTVSNGNITLEILCNNNQMGDVLPFVRVYQTQNGPTLYQYIQYIDDNGSSTNYNVIKVFIDHTNLNLSVSHTTSDGYNLTYFGFPDAHNVEVSDGVYYAYFPGVFGIREKNIPQYSNYNPTVACRYRGESSYFWRELSNSCEIESMIYIPPTPEPSGDSSGEFVPSGTITNPSGEITGSIDLSGIENSLTNIENKIPTSGEISNIISGEVGKITETLTDIPDLSETQISSGEIINSLGFELASDRYSNFWLTLTNNLKASLLGVKRSLQISFQGNTWTIDLDDFAILPVWLTIIIMPFSTSFFVWILVKWWKLIIDKLTSGNVDSLLKENSEEGISNML